MPCVLRTQQLPIFKVNLAALSCCNLMLLLQQLHNYQLSE